MSVDVSVYGVLHSPWVRVRYFKGVIAAGIGGVVTFFGFLMVGVSSD